MMIWTILSKNDLNLSHRKQFNAPSYVRLATSLMKFECQPCGIFEVLSHHQKYGDIAPNTFAYCVLLGDRINNLV